MNLNTFVRSSRLMKLIGSLFQTINTISEATTDNHVQEHSGLSQEDRIAAHALRLARTSVPQAILYMEQNIAPSKFIIECPKYTDFSEI